MSIQKAFTKWSPICSSYFAELNRNRKIKFVFTAAAIAWEKRMRKKLKKSLRKQKNFKGNYFF